MTSDGCDTIDRVVARPEGEEEVTPPYSSKTRSFDSLAVAHVLTGGMQHDMGPPRLPSPPSSPTLTAAAEGLLDVRRQPSASTDSAVDCLMSLSSLAKRGRDDSEADEEAEPKNKRPAPEQLHAARRRLKMRTAGVSSPLARPGNSMRAPVSRPPPVQLLSGATVEQLKLLAAAYKLCPTPTPDQLLAIAERVSIAPDALNVWFQSRKVLQDWVQQQPNMNINDLKSMFYGQQQPATSEA